MSYRIIYDWEPEQRGRAHPCRRLMLTVCFFCLFLWAVGNFWPEGYAFVRSAMLSDGTMEAAQVFAQELGCGFPIRDAAGNFIDTVFRHGFPG